MNRTCATLLFGLALAPTAIGCSGSISGDGGDGDGASGDKTTPVVEIQTPERGTIAENPSVLVTGRVTDADSAIAQVTVNGNPAALSSDGTFAAELTVAEGITLLETVALDAAGNQAIDTRAVLTGTMVDQSTPVAEGVVANVSSEAMSGLTAMVSEVANGTDFTALATALNPVVDTGNSCNDAKVFVDTIEHAGVEVGAVAATGGIDADVSIRNLVVRGHVDYEAICVNRSASFTITADAYDVGGLIAPALAGGDISIGLDGLTSGFRGFSLEVSGVPGFVEDLVEGRVRDKLAEILRDKIVEMVPPIANSFLSDFLADSWAVSVFGQNLELAITPTEMTWTPQGGTIVLDTHAGVAGVEGATYLSTPRPRPVDADVAGSGLRIGLADDVINQLLGSIWTSGALEDALLPVEGDALSAAFGADVASATLTLMLPPVTNFDTETGTARLTLGDLMVEAVGGGGETLAKFVMSAEIELAVETSSNGRVKVITRTPRILAQVLQQSDVLLTELTNQKVAAIAELAIKQISLKADGLLENLPVPGIGDATIMSPTFQPVGGYLLMGGQLAFQ